MSKTDSRFNSSPTNSIPYEFSNNKWKLAKGKNNYGRLKGHSLHYIGPYSGSFPPELVHYFLYKYSDPNDLILDPFSGRGTTGLQAVLNNRKIVVNDVNPLAFIYSFAKLFPLSSSEVEKALEKIPFHDTSYQDPIPPEKKEELLAYFHKDTIEELNILKTYLSRNDSIETRYLKALVAGTLRGNRISNLSITMSGLICFSAKYMRKWSVENNTWPEYREVSSRLISKAERLEKDGIHFRRDSIVLQEDATRLNPVQDNSIDLIITSPPYFNVINYAYDNRIRLWMLNHDYREIKKKLCLTASIPKYSQFIEQSLTEMYRVLKDDSWAVIVVGDVKRKNEKNKPYYLNTAEIISKIGMKLGFGIDKIINDSLPDEKGTCGRATSITNNISVKLDRCVILKKGQPEERNHQINWGHLVNPKAK